MTNESREPWSPDEEGRYYATTTCPSCGGHNEHKKGCSPSLKTVLPPDGVHPENHDIVEGSVFRARRYASPEAFPGTHVAEWTVKVYSISGTRAYVTPNGFGPEAWFMLSDPRRQLIPNFDACITFAEDAFYDEEEDD